MLSTNGLVSGINKDIRAQGEVLAACGKVYDLQKGPDWIVAIVHETGRYRVEIDFDDQGVISDCTCPSCESRPQPCRHVWAVLVASGMLRGARNSPPPPPTWKDHLAALRRTTAPQPAESDMAAPSVATRQIIYLIDPKAALERQQGLVIRIASRDAKANGGWTKARVRSTSNIEVTASNDPADRQLLPMLKGLAPTSYYSYSSGEAITIEPEMYDVVVPLLCASGRAFVRNSEEQYDAPLRWEGGQPWQFYLEAQLDSEKQEYVLTGLFRREAARMLLSEPQMLIAGGLLFNDNCIHPLDDRGAFQWVAALRDLKALRVPAAQREQLVAELLTMPALPRLDLPDEIRVEEVTAVPRPALHIRAPKRDEYPPEKLRAELHFDYDGLEIDSADPRRPSVPDAKRRRRVRRDAVAEAAAAARLHELHVRSFNSYSHGGRELRLDRKHLPRVVRELVADGWHVQADGKLYRQPGKVDIQVTSAIDWFELRGSVDFDGQSVDLPVLLAALRRGDSLVALGDGAVGMLPEDWLKKYGLLAGAGKADDGFIKFTKCQAGLLDALLASQPEARCDEVFERTRRELRSFEGIGAADAPDGFTGELRPYQREGLGWFDFLHRFGFGGCLADDMGLGKTVQVLARIQARRAASVNGDARPSLVVVPRSLIFNWKQEAARFTPNLRILDNSLVDRSRDGSEFVGYDLILTTYGTLRRDIVFLKDICFDYVILDEAQAIKNAASESAKAARLLQADHRLALSGTPVQNHLGDLWSLFDFLNPGMLGGASVFTGAAGALRNPDEETRTVLARALRPFILRRTKEQVASDLPERLEQTIYCEMEPAQRKLYNELRDHYRRSLMDKISADGINKSKIQILEALLRLRQAALHPGLLDKARRADPSAKLDMLLPRLAEVIEEGHKALVFSQFTSMLSIVKAALGKQKVPYEYLDGQTKDRQGRVDHFQSDPVCKLFLISLKAGGLGLNLTAADYVFLLDPWWNPAVEQQAIDRAHRIGQTKQVYACRLIAKDTVEEKVLALQQTKRDLADAIITADNSLIRGLGREDLELLLS